MAYDDTNTGVLFKNDRKESDKHPDYRGSININGEDFWLSAWLNTAQKGEHKGSKYMSLKTRSKNDNSNRDARDLASSQSYGKTKFDDDIPF